ncbi:MAG: prepilin-type N-terminal cleavage/methylation domain-containing protein [Oscillospiraceae bacterium]|nr:prepilin-type N-terminal cleavage/methylation domain-containing protein [Oscillospiraceae bacterium]
MKFRFQCPIDRKDIPQRSRRGFTLLEIVLAVALMLIITLIIYQGFMSTLQYSGNTAMFERTAQANNQSANAHIGAGTANGGTSDEGIYLANNSGTFFQVIRVNTEDKTAVDPDWQYGEAAFNENAQSSATHRYSFHYVVRPCPDPACDGTVRFYENTVTGMVDARCNKDGCYWHDPKHPIHSYTS